MSSPYPETPQAPSAPPPPPVSSDDEKMWAMLCHLAALAAFVFPLGNVIGPLVVWLVKKDEFPLVEDQGKESLNFQISVTIYGAVAFLLVFVLIGFLLLPVVGLFYLIMTIVGAVKANQGIAYRYPLCIRFIN